MDFSELIRVRRSVRAYNPSEITEAEINELIEAVKLAPTWKNSQTGRYYIATSQNAMAKVNACLPSFNQRSSTNASALIVTTFVKDVAGFTAGAADNEVGNEWGAYDLGLQNAYLTLKASDMGLDTLIMGLRDAEGLRSALNIPENEEVMAVIAVGKRATEPLLKARKSFEEIAKVL